MVELMNRRITLDHVALSGYPLTHMDRDHTHRVDSPVPELGEAGLSRTYPTITATLVIPVLRNGKLAPKERVFDVHYHLLWLASLSDYEQGVVPYTAYGLTRDMGWGEGGRQNGMLRRCVDHLYGMEVEVDGDAMPDPVLPGLRPGIVRFRVLIERGYPKEEALRSGRRNASYIVYSPTYLNAVSRSGGVQIDVEMLKEMTGGLSKGMYRTLSWLRNRGLDRILLDEAFERVGSARKSRYPSDANAGFASCFEVLTRYQYLKRPPEYETDVKGNYWMRLDWGDTVRLPARGDAAFRELTVQGVHPRTAEKMLNQDRMRVADVLIAVRSGALGSPRGSMAQMLVGLFNSDWMPPGLSLKKGRAVRGVSQQLCLDDHFDDEYVAESISPEDAFSVLSLDDLLGRVRAEASRSTREVWLRMLKEHHGVTPEKIGYRADGSSL
jgi:hypothetical protein